MFCALRWALTAALISSMTFRIRPRSGVEFHGLMLEISYKVFRLMYDIGDFLELW
jgi:hypothetical protein